MMYDVSEIDRNGNLSHFHHNVPRDYLRKPTRRGSVINSSPTNGTRKKLHLSGRKNYYYESVYSIYIYYTVAHLVIVVVIN